MCVHHTKNYWRKAHGGVSGWIGKSGSDAGGDRLDQEGQQKHLSKEKLDWREEDERATRAALIREQEVLILLAIAPCKK